MSGIAMYDYGIHMVVWFIVTVECVFHIFDKILICLKVCKECTRDPVILDLMEIKTLSLDKRKMVL